MRKAIATLFAGVLIGVATLTAGNGLIAAQESTPAAESAAMGDEAGMMQMATPGAKDAETMAKMEQMMDQCQAMMQMMSMMMGGDMSGMTGGEDMQGMMGTPEATPAPEG